jgi:O-antigen/teichoic acid export membrane protein
MTAASDEDDDGYLVEVVRKSSVGIAAFTAERIVLAVVAYIVTAVSGAAAYGFFSVFTRGEAISRNLVAGLGDGYTRTVPRVSVSAQRTLLSVGTVGFVIVWTVVATVVVTFRGLIVDATLLQPRHEGVVVLFAVGLLPFLLLRNIRDMFRALRRIKLAMLVSRIFTPVSLLAGTVFVVLAGGRSLFSIWVGVVVVALLLTVTSAFLLAYYTEVSAGPFRSHRSVVRNFLQYSANTTGVAVLELVQRRAVFAVMALYLSPVAAGAFSLSIVVGLVVRWPLSGVNGILPPIAATLYGDGKEQTLQRLYQQTSRLATVATTPAFVLGYAYAPDLLAVFNEAYVQQATVLRLVLGAQYIATVFGSVGLLLLMTDNERASLLVQIVNAGVALPLMIVLTVRFGPLGLGTAYLLSLILNNTTELLLLYFRDGLIPFSREQAYAVLLVAPFIYTITLGKSVAGLTASVVLIGLTVVAYTWVGRRFLLRSADRAAVRALLPCPATPRPDSPDRVV